MTYFRRTTLVGILLAASSLSQLQAQHHQPKISHDLAGTSSSATVPVIIQYNVQPTATHVGRIQQTGGSAGKMFSHVPAIAAQVPGSAINQLASDPDVKFISVDRPVTSRAAWYSAEPVNAPELWTGGLYGSGVGVAVIDSGIAPNLPDLAYGIPGLIARGSRIVYQHNFVAQPDGKTAQTTNDQYGHGTHVAGIIAGNGTKSTGNQYTRSFRGIAPNANLIDLQVLDQNGQGTDSNVIAAIEMAIALKNTYNIRVINLSLGRPVYESYTVDPLCQAVEEAWKAGIVVVVAAGNDGRLQSFNPEGYGTINSPGNDPYVVTVGAANTNGSASISDDTVASYSSKGPSLIDDVAKPDIMAPGSQIASLRVPPSTLVKGNPSLVTLKRDYMTDNGQASSPDYFPLSGTSMASAVVSGAAAVLLQAQPSLTPDQVKALLMRDAYKSVFPASSTVTDNTGTYKDYNDLLTIGAGYLNIQASVEDALTHAVNLPKGYALSPTVTMDSTTNQMSLNFNQSSLWTYDTTWAPAAVYGTQSFDNSVNGSTIIWGRSTITGSTIIWGRSSLTGSTIIWGRNGVDGSTIIWGRSGDQGSTIIWGRSNDSADSSTLLY